MFAAAVTIDDASINIAIQAATAVVTFVGAWFAIRRWGQTVVSSIKFATLGIFVSALLLTGWMSSRILNNSSFNAKVSDYVAAAYKTDSKERAKKYLTSAIDYLKSSNRHKGFSAVFSGGQGDDLEEWTNDLVAIRDGIDTVPVVDKKSSSVLTIPESSSSSAEEIKPKIRVTDDAGKDITKPEEILPVKVSWREKLKAMNFVTLKKDTDTVDDIHCPSGISVAPYNSYYAIWCVGSIGLLLSCCGWFFYASNPKLPPTPKTQVCRSCGRNPNL